MVNEYWGLSKKPFSNTPDLNFMFNSNGFEEGYARLLYNITEIKGGLTLITGDVGCGKTYLANALRESLKKQNALPFIIGNPKLSSNQLIKVILQKIGIEEIPRFKLAILNLLEKKLEELNNKGIIVVALIDEAQILSLDALREVRLLLNLETSQEKLLHIVLLGQPELKRIIDRVPQLKQRVNVRFHLEPLSKEETKAYVIHRLKVAGSEREIFEESSLDKLYEVSKGIPRVINNIAQNALFVAATENLKKIPPEIIEAVAFDLEV
ncbi:MAG: AAA family ATPase [candidate division WOR-3 bacterium]